MVQKNPGPDDINPSRLTYQRLKLYINETKSVSGNEVTFLGFLINFRTKMVRIGDKALQKTADKLSSCFSPNASIGLYVNIDILESLLGSLNFLSQCTMLGRTKAYHLRALYKHGLHNKEKTLLLNQFAYSEIIFWKNYVENPDAVRLGRAIKVYSTIKYDWSDSSLQRWAFKTYKNGTVFTRNGTFPKSIEGKGIFEKESYALFELVKELPPNSEHVIRVDNRALVLAYRKGSSKNLYVNTVLSSILLELQLKNSYAEVLWVDTFTMSLEGADQLSRGRNDEMFDPFSLSPRGAGLLSQVYGAIDLDLFASTKNNPFRTFYHSNHQIVDETLCLTGDGLERLGKGLTPGVSFIFPPSSLVGLVIDLVKQSKRPASYGVILVAYSCYDGPIRTHFQLEKNFSSWTLQNAGKPTKYLNMKLRDYDVLVYSFGDLARMDNDSLPIENFMRSAKRIRYE